MVLQTPHVIEKERDIAAENVWEEKEGSSTSWKEVRQNTRT